MEATEMAFITYTEQIVPSAHTSTKVDNKHTFCPARGGHRPPGQVEKLGTTQYI